jgi:hypothetical protein
MNKHHEREKNIAWKRRNGNGDVRTTIMMIGQQISPRVRSQVGMI